MPKPRARSPCLTAFIAERALPSGVLGPRLFGPAVRVWAGAGSGMAANPGADGPPSSIAVLGKYCYNGAREGRRAVRVRADRQAGLFSVRGTGYGHGRTGQRPERARVL